jgi:hemolysin activation/secretion protein
MTSTCLAHVVPTRRDAPFWGGGLVVALLVLLAPVTARAVDASLVEPPPPPLALDPSVPVLPADPTPRFYIQEFRVDGGGDLLSRNEIETAVYPFMGPYRSPQDVDKARAALEKAYHDKGYQTVTVTVPQQHARTGIIHLQVARGEVERLNVVGSRFFSIEEIKREAPSLQEGTSPNFSQVTSDIVALNQLADRRVTPEIVPGATPGTVDVNLKVKDSFPMHGSVELNNRYSANTKELRLNGAISYDNLWQLEHSAGFSFQTSPEDTNQVQVYSGYYSAHIPDWDWLTLMVQGTYQDSTVNTLGGIGVVGKSKIIGMRAVFNLPQFTGYFHTLSLGLDYKHSDQNVMTAGQPSMSPVTYYPISAAYSGSWIGKGYETDVNASFNFSIGGWDSSPEQFGQERYGADGRYVYFRSDLSHTHDLPEGTQIFAKVQGQAADKPLINSEQFSGGGLGTIRGYLESEDLGDNGIIGNLELRTPSLSEIMGKAVDEWRFYIFGDYGLLTIDQALPGQQEKFKLASVGWGTRIKLSDHYNGSLDFGLPLNNSVDTQAYEPRFTFRAWAEF